MKKKKPSRQRQQTPLWAGVPPAPPAARPQGAAPAVPSPQAPRRWAHLMALAEAIETAEEALRPVLKKLDAAFAQPYPPSEEPQVAALLDCYAAMQAQLVAALAPLRPKLEAAWAEQEAIWRAAEAGGVAEPRITYGLAPLPPDQQTLAGCEEAWRAGTACAIPATYVLWQHVRDDPTATPPVWYYCPQHAQEAIARLGLAWPA